MANDYVALQNRIANEMRGISNAGSSRVAGEIQNAIQTAIKFYERQRFYFNTKIGTFSTVIAQETYASAANPDIPNIVEIDAAKLTLVNGAFQAIAGRAFTDIHGEQDGTNVGDPKFFAYYAQQIWLEPIPNAVRLVTMAYVYRLAPLVNPNDTNAWTTDGEELIRQRAKRILAMDVLGADPGADKLAERAGMLEKEVYGALKEETVLRRRWERQSTDAPIPSGFSSAKG